MYNRASWGTPHCSSLDEAVTQSMIANEGFLLHNRAVIGAGQGLVSQSYDGYYASSAPPGDPPNFCKASAISCSHVVWCMVACCCGIRQGVWLSCPCRVVHSQGLGFKSHRMPAAGTCMLVAHRVTLPKTCSVVGHCLPAARVCNKNA